MVLPTIPSLIRMGLGWYAGRSITSKVKREILGSVLSAYRREGLALPSTRQVLRYAQEAGIGIRRQDFVRMHTKERVAIRQIGAQRSASRAAMIDIHNVPVGRFDKGTKYQYHFQVKRIDSRTGREVVSDVWWHRSRLMRPDTAIRQFMEQYGHSYQDRYNPPHGVELLEVWQRQ